MKGILVLPKCLFWLFFIHLHESIQEDVPNDSLHPLKQNTTSNDKIDSAEYEEILFSKKTYDEKDAFHSRQYDREIPREEPSNMAEEDENLPNSWPRALALESSPTISLNKTNDKGPALNQANNTEVLAQVGGTATLSCFTGHISDEVVTWMKHDDKLLTIGQDVYGKEERFSASLSHTTKAWELFVKEVQMSDAGQYECQLTTHPPVTFYFTLKVKQAKAEIIGSPEVHIEEGSQLALQCQVQDAPYPPIYIFWYHNRTMVNYERKRDLNVHHENFTSSLVVAKVTSTDAGIYTCEPHLATSANVNVHVVNEEKPAAMQHGRNHVSGTGGVFPLNNRHLLSLTSLFSSYLLLFLPSIVVAMLNYFYSSSTALKAVETRSRNSIRAISHRVPLM